MWGLRITWIEINWMQKYMHGLGSLHSASIIGTDNFSALLVVFATFKPNITLELDLESFGTKCGAASHSDTNMIWKLPFLPNSYKKCQKHSSCSTGYFLAVSCDVFGGLQNYFHWFDFFWSSIFPTYLNSTSILFVLSVKLVRSSFDKQFCSAFRSRCPCSSSICYILASSCSSWILSLSKPSSSI